MESYQGCKTFLLLSKHNGYPGWWWKENILLSVSHPQALLPHLRVIEKRYQGHHVALLPGVPYLLEHSKRVKTSLPRPPSLYKWFLNSEDPFKSISGAPASPSKTSSSLIKIIYCAYICLKPPPRKWDVDLGVFSVLTF